MAHLTWHKPDAHGRMVRQNGHSAARDRCGGLTVLHSRQPISVLAAVRRLVPVPATAVASVPTAQPLTGHCLYRVEDDMKWTESIHCTSRAHCAACQNDENFRNSIMKSFGWDGVCVHRNTAYQPKPPVVKNNPKPPEAKPKGKGCGSCAERRKHFKEVQFRLSICKKCPMCEENFCNLALMSCVELADLGEACPEGCWTDISDIKKQGLEK